MHEVICETRQHQMKGGPPEGYATWQEFAASIALYPNVDLAGLTAGDDDPFFVTLDVMRVGETSLNGLVYDEAFVETVEQQLAGKGAVLGHSGRDEFPIEVADWVGHVRVDGVTWAKAYIPPGREREFIRRILRRGGELRTSLQGMGVKVSNADGSYRLRDFVLERLDFVPATQAALRRATSGKLVVTKEVSLEEKMGDQEVARVAELEQARDAALARVGELEQARDAALARIAELEQAQEAAMARIAEFERVAFEREVDAAIAALTEGWNVRTEAGKSKLAALHKQLRRALVMELGGSREAAVIRETAQRLWDEEFRVIAESLRDSLAGPAAVVGAPTSGKTALSDEALEKMAKRFVK